MLFSTAQWQYLRAGSDSAKRLAKALPTLLANYVLLAGPNVHLVHVGPERYPLASVLEERYHWVAPLPEEQYNILVASVDLLVTANVAATTIARAMVAEVPVVVLENSMRGETLEEVEGATKRPLAEVVRTWLAGVLPLFPFSMWPVGYRQFLAPLLEANSYCHAIERVELLDVDRVVSAIQGLTDERGTERSDHLHRQAAFLAAVRALPSPAETIHGLLD